MKAMRLMAIVAVPVFFGISAIAPEIVSLIFGPQWHAAEPILAVLSLAMTFRAILLVIPNFLQGIGNARAGFWCTATGALLFPPAFLIGCHWGALGICYAWLLVYPVMFIMNAVLASRHGGLDFSQLLAIPLKPIAAGIAMLVAVAAARALLPNQSNIFGLGILVPIGAATYAAVMVLVFRPLALEVVSLVLSRRSRAV
jgi:O-antigen/teichoic acid export membrane protein